MTFCITDQYTASGRALTANADQIALWNDTAGRAWVETQETLDAVLARFEDLGRHEVS